MSSKIFKALFFFFSLILLNIHVFANNGDEIDIISRSEWGANESYRYLDGDEWKALIKKWKNLPKKELTSYQIKRAKIEASKVKIANNFLVKNYSDIIGVKTIEKSENGHKLAWPIARVNRRTSIVIHHTDSEYKNTNDPYSAIKNIYKYHSISRGWGDIGYNYLIGYNGEIFEGRAGGDDVVGAHDKWNNQSSIGIALIGNYDKKDINQKQYDSLKKLTKFLVKKYNIDLSEKTAFFKWCVGTSINCREKPLVIDYNYPIIGHKDAGHTACPGEKLYTRLQLLKKELKVGITTKNQILLKKIYKVFSKYNDEELILILSKIELLLDKKITSKKRFLLLEVKDIILKIENKRSTENFGDKLKVSFDDNNKIKVKLSYPFDDFIKLKITGKYTAKFVKQNTQYLISFYERNIEEKTINLRFKLIGDNLFLSGKKVLDFTEVKFFRISVPKGKIIQINSWDRKPVWDKTGKLNDNEFKGDIILYKKDNKLVVVNELYLNDYLKGLGEVSNNTNPEKIKAIIVLARTYARWYMTKARKFAGEWFDASDNPNIFQKYLGFGLEKRSPKVNEIVEKTKDLVVTYDGELIKPWYFSSSNGKTISFIDYCKTAKGIPDCNHPEKFPFLLGVSDNGGIGKKRAGHGVGVPGTGVEYFSVRGLDFSSIIRYFLKSTVIKYY